MNSDLLSAVKLNIVGLHNAINDDIALVHKQFHESRLQQSVLMRSLVSRYRKNQRDLNDALQLIDKLIKETEREATNAEPSN